MINNGTVHYDHDRDGTHSQVSGCHVCYIMLYILMFYLLGQV